MNADLELLKNLEKCCTSNPRSLTTPCTTDQLDRSLNLNDFELGLMREIIGDPDIATALQQYRSKSPEDSADFPAMGATPSVVRDAVALNRDFTAGQCSEVVSGGKGHRPPPLVKEALPKRRYKGVYLRPSGKFTAEIHTGKGSRLWLGTYHTAEQAAMAFDRAALKVRGSQAVLNFPDLIGTYNVSPEKDNSKNLSPWTEGSPESLSPALSTNPQLFLSSQDQSEADILNRSPITLKDAHIQPSKRSKTFDSKTYKTSSDTQIYRDFKDEDEGFNFDEPQRSHLKGKKQTSSSPGRRIEKLLKIVSEFTKFSNVNKQDVDDRKRHRAKLEEIETENLRLMEEQMREKRHEKDLQFYRQPHDHLTGPQLNMVLARKRAIAKRWSWKM